MEKQSKDSNDPLLKQSNDYYRNENTYIYKSLFESRMFTPLPSFKKAIQGRKEMPNILSILPSSEKSQFKLPTNEKLNHILKQQTLKRDKVLSEIKVFHFNSI